MHDKGLTPNQKFILAEIHQLSSLKKGCLASNKHFSELTGITTQGVSKAINDLEKKGYITIDNAQAKRNFGREITINYRKSPINYRKSPINYRKSPINCGLESKENIQDNKKNPYQLFIEELEQKVPLPSKVTATKEGQEYFKKISDVDALIVEYITYQQDTGEFAKRITPFMKDYVARDRSGNENGLIFA